MLLLSGFFSSAETALFSISSTKAIHLAKEDGKTGKLIKKMKDDSHNLLSVILIGNNIVNVGASSLATALAISIYESNAVGIATFVMTFLILVFGEIFPKSIATQNNIAVAKFVIYPLYWLSFVLKPVVLVLNFIPVITGGIKKTPSVTEEELMTIVEVVEEEGEIKEEEKEFITNIFEFDDTSASEIMTPRADMFAIDVKNELNLEEMLKTGYTRIPVIEENIDNVIGIIYIKDIFRFKVTSNGPIDIRKLMKKPYFIPESKKIDRVLHQFKKMKQHMAVIVDEHGGVSGIITLEDVIEEIVGEIIDETDKEDPTIIKLNQRKWFVPGKTDIDDVNEVIDLNIPDTKEYETF